MSKNQKIGVILQRALRDSCAKGSSRHSAKHDGTAADHIYSDKTYKTYSETAVRPFGEWAQERGIHRDIDACKDAVPAYLEELRERGLSNHSISTHRAGLCKAFHLAGHDLDPITISRPRDEISRSRGEYSERFNADKHAELVNFVHSTGLRRCELETLTKDALRVDEEGNHYLHIYGKGGKERDVYPFGDHADAVIAKVSNTPAGDNVWGKQPSYVPMHRMRAEAAAILYHQHERPLEELSRKDKYYCQRDMAGKVFDRAALMVVSNALGHNRLDVVVSHYSYLF